MNFLQLEVVWTDSDDMLQLAVTATGTTHSAYHETYLYPESLAAFAAVLETFPTKGEAEAPRSKPG
ncbi:MAG TPA: hypothetical protein VIU34_17060 [Steroidobacter sp.]